MPSSGGDADLLGQFLPALPSKALGSAFSSEAFELVLGLGRVEHGFPAGGDGEGEESRRGECRRVLHRAQYLKAGGPGRAVG